MRVTSDLWVSALLKRIFSDGGFATIRRRGAREAGAIFLIRRTRLGELHFYGPAPQTSYDEAKPDDRQFTHVTTTTEEADIERHLEKEMRFDPDVWIVEVEMDSDISDYLALATD
ncbi:DUF1491 family protein [Chelativorans sp. YIM 93263]|uniref:DUF1491 family protein n=1 Tax=Chelativorans sp. YIM 93263 TaxID=2906648 RepID=UPI002379D99D|nr:DUF1491 family protein [Chelativorans sp. YIM 93263]